MGGRRSRRSLRTAAATSIKDSSFDSTFSAGLLSAPRLVGASGPRLLVIFPSTAQRGSQPEEDPLVRIPCQEPIEDATAATSQLARDSDERLHERPELHAQNPLLLLALGRLMTPRRDR